MQLSSRQKSNSKELGDKFAADKRAPIDAALNELKEAHKAQNIDAIDPCNR